MLKEKYKLWLENVNPKEQELLKNYSEDDILESFNSDLSFGTGGIRGVMGLGTSKINKYTLAKVTHGFAKYLINKNNKKTKVVISYDNRHNSQSFALDTSLILSSYGIEVLMFEELAPTPLLSYAVRYYNAQGGIMITASHNPKEYNGYKVYDESGSQLNLIDSNELINEINKINTWFFKDNSNKKLVKFIYHEVINSYLNELNSVRINKDNKNISILYSPLHGTGSKIGVLALEKQGFKVIPYWDHLINDPNFSKTVSSNPEDKSVYDILIKEAKDSNIDLILTNDPDADRYGVCVKDRNNDYRLLTGNEVATIVLNYLLEFGKYKENQLIYTTIVSTPLLEVISKYYNQKLVYTLTGFKFIGEMIRINSPKHDFIFGAEESNGFLINDFVRDKDGISAITIIAEIANYYMKDGKTLVDVLDEIHQKFGYYKEQTISINLAGLEGVNKINNIMNDFITNDFLILDTTIVEKINFNESYKMEFNTLPPSNVVKYIYEDKSWICIRPSGTEPKIKFYIGSARNSETLAQDRINEIIDLISKRVESL